MIERHAEKRAPEVSVDEMLTGSYVCVSSRLSSSRRQDDRHFAPITDASRATSPPMRKVKQKRSVTRTSMRSSGTEVCIFAARRIRWKLFGTEVIFFDYEFSQGCCWYREIEIERYDISERRSDFSPSSSITITFRLFGPIKSRRRGLDREAILRPSADLVVFFFFW